MGKTMTKIRVTNAMDLELNDLGRLPAEAMRSVELEALVDTGATTLALPQEVADALGLIEKRKRRVRLANGSIVELPVVFVAYEILGRQTVGEAFILPAGSTALIGQIPLEALDLIVDPMAQEVRVNPASPDEPTLDLLRAS
jgi:clan AA aspartic protease